jgi:hypothetical protein
MLLQWGNKHLASDLLSGHAGVAANKLMETVLSHLSDVAHVLYEFHAQEQTRGKSTALRRSVVKKERSAENTAA